jgi:SPP1 family predicted phage head-tail adaptor
MKYRIQAGKYRSPLDIESRATTTDTYGGSTESWSTFVSVRGAIMPLSGREFFQADIVNSEITHRVHIRYIQGIKPTMRINFNGRYFKIESVINYSEQNIELQLYCKEIVE